MNIWEQTKCTSRWRWGACPRGWRSWAHILNHTAGLSMKLVSPEMFQTWSEQTIWLVLFHRVIKRSNLIGPNCSTLWQVCEIKTKSSVLGRQKFPSWNGFWNTYVLCVAGWAPQPSHNMPGAPLLLWPFLANTVRIELLLSSRICFYTGPLSALWETQKLQPITPMTASL